MTWFADLSHCSYVPVEDTSRLVAVGWLDVAHPYATGQLECAVIQALTKMAEQPWQPMLFLGWHDCTICMNADGPRSIAVDGKLVAIGVSNLFVPDLRRSCVYVAPSMILHYISAHKYRPPDEFCEAVLACAPVETVEYLEQLRLAAGPGMFGRPKRGVDSEGA